jgi:hypothetical protein
MDKDTKFNTKAIVSLAKLVKTNMLEERTWTNHVQAPLQN